MNSDFTPAPEELNRLAQEIGLLRRDFQTGIAALGRMEKRIKAAFPNYAPKKQARPKSIAGVRSGSSKTPDQLQSDFESLLGATKERGDLGFESSISALAEHDIIALAHELGIGSLKTTSVKKAREGIRKRIQESLLLSYNRKTDHRQ